MEIKTTEQILDENSERSEFKECTEKWVAVDDVINELREIDAAYAEDKAHDIRRLLNKLNTNNQK